MLPCPSGNVSCSCGVLMCRMKVSRENYIRGARMRKVGAAVAYFLCTHQTDSVVCFSMMHSDPPCPLKGLCFLSEHA